VKKLVLSIGFMTLAICSAQAQETSIFNKIHAAFQTKGRFIAGFNNNRSIANGEPVRFFGIMAGLDYQDWLKVYLGANFMNPVLTNRQISFNGNSFDTLNDRLSLNYWSVTTEFTYYRTQNWKLSMPIAVGLGISDYTLTKLGVGVIRETHRPVYPIEVGTQAIYFINPWLGAKAGFGIRLAPGKESFNTFSAPFYKIGLAFYPIELYKQFFDK
jgi:hypothetical protein